MRKRKLTVYLATSIVIVFFILVSGLPNLPFLKLNQFKHHEVSRKVSREVSQEAPKVELLDLSELKKSEIPLNQASAIENIAILDPVSLINLSKVEVLNNQLFKKLSAESTFVDLENEKFLLFKIKENQELSRRFASIKGVLVDSEGAVYVSSSLKIPDKGSINKLIELDSSYFDPDFIAKVTALKNPVEIKQERDKLVLMNKENSETAGVIMIVELKDQDNKPFLVKLNPTSASFFKDAGTLLSNCLMQESQCLKYSVDISEQAIYPDAAMLIREN